MATDKQIDNLILNRLTKEQYESIDNPDSDQLYFVPEDEDTLENVIISKGLVSSEEATKIKVLTQAEYDALVTKDANTLYFVKES